MKHVPGYLGSKREAYVPVMNIIGVFALALGKIIWIAAHLTACFFIIVHNGVNLGWF